MLLLGLLLAPRGLERVADTARTAPATTAAWGLAVGIAVPVAAVVAAALGWIGLSASYEASLHHNVRLAAGATVVIAYTLGFAAAGAGRLILKRA